MITEQHKRISAAYDSVTDDPEWAAQQMEEEDTTRTEDDLTVWHQATRVGSIWRSRFVGTEWLLRHNDHYYYWYDEDNDPTVPMSDRDAALMQAHPKFEPAKVQPEGLDPRSFDDDFAEVMP